MTERRVTLAMGAGGIESADLVASLFRARFDGPDGAADPFADAAAIAAPGGRLLFSTDSFVVTPRFFPGGDLGKLAVCGTANDLAVAGGRPLALSCGVILEEGLPLAELERLADSMAAMLAEIGCRVATGDTKVVARGEADGIYVNTAGIGAPLRADAPAGITAIRPGDALLLSGPPGAHGLAILAAREGLSDDPRIVSDCAFVGRATAALVAGLGPAVRLMRDPTRGGVATTLWECARGRPHSIELSEEAIPLSPPHAALAALLGLDLLHLPCEGRFLAFVAPDAADDAIRILRDAGCPQAARIGEVTPDPAGRVVVRTTIGGRRTLLPQSGEQLPRIC